MLKNRWGRLSSPLYYGKQAHKEHAQKNESIPLREVEPPSTTLNNALKVVNESEEKSGQNQEDLTNAAARERRPTELDTSEQKRLKPSPTEFDRERSRSKASPIDPAKRRERLSYTSIRSLSEHRESPYYLPTVFSVFLGMNIITTYNFMFCLYIPENRGFLLQIFSEEADIKKQLLICYYSRYFGPWLAVFYAYLANSYVGEKLMLVFSMLLGLLSPIANLMALISPGNRARQIFARLSPIFGIGLFATELYRNCIILEQLKHPDQGEWIPFYVFWFSYINFVGLVLAKFTIDLCQHVPAVVTIHCYFCLFLVILHLMVLLKLNEKIVSIKPHRRVIERNIFVTLPYVFTCGRRKLSLTRGQRRFWSLILIYSTFLTFGTGYEAVKKTTYYYHSPLLQFEKINEHMDGFLWHLIVNILILPIGEFAILPFLETVKLVRKRFQRLGLSYVYLIFAIVCSFLLETNMSGRIGTLPTRTNSQLRVYNVLPSSVLLTTNLTRNAWRIEPRFKLELHGIASNRDGVAIGINMSVEDPPSNARYTLILKGGFSHSCIISRRGLYAVQEVDPIIFDPQEDHVITHARIFVISAIANLTGKISYRYSESKINDTFPNTKDSTISNVPANTYEIYFYKEEAAYNLGEDIKFSKGGIYVMIIYELENGLLNMTCYSLILPADIHPAWTTLPLAFLSLGEMRARVSGVSVILSDSPPSARLFIMMYEYAMTVNGIGIPYFISLNHKTIVSFLTASLILVLVGFLIYVYLALQYKRRL